MPNIFQALDQASSSAYAKFHPQTGLASGAALDAAAAAVKPLAQPSVQVVAPLRADLVLQVLLFLAGEQDREVWLQEARRHLGSEHLAALARVDDNLPQVYLLSKAERLLLAVLAQAYLVGRSREPAEDGRYLQLQTAFGLTERASAFIRKQVQESGLAGLSSGHSDIAVLLAPPEELLAEILPLIAAAGQTNGCFARENLRGLTSREYEHELDKAALRTLEGTPGLEPLVRKFNQWGVERYMRIKYTGSNLRITEQSLPALHRMLVEVCDTLSLGFVPEFYMQQDPTINACAIGVERPMIVLNSGCLAHLSADELTFIIGHEAGHIKSQHMLYHQMGSLLPMLGQIIGSMTLGIGNLVSTGLQIALYNWIRKSELTADRAGLLACQDVNASIRAQMRLAGYPPIALSSADVLSFIQQAEEFEGFDEDNLDRIVKVLSVMEASHPWTVMRGAELHRWVENGNYQRTVQSRSYVQPAIAAAAQGQGQSQASASGYCPSCGRALAAEQNFCPGCGTPRPPR